MCSLKSVPRFVPWSEFVPFKHFKRCSNGNWGPILRCYWIKPMDTYGPSPSATPEPKIIVKIPVTSTVQRRNPQSPGDLGWEVPNFISAAACSILRTSMNERSSVYQRIWSCSKRRYTVYPNHGNFDKEADFRTIMCF